MICMEWQDLISWHGWNKLFWTLFIVIGAILIIGSIIGIFTLVEVLIAFIVIAIGAEKLGEEISDKRLQEEQGRINRDLMFVSRWLENNNVFTRQMKDRHEMRFFNMDQKRAETEKSQESSYRDMARKLIDLENRVNQLSKAVEKAGMVKPRPVVFQTAKDLGLDLIPKPMVAPKPGLKAKSPPTPKPPKVTVPRAPAFDRAWTQIVGVARRRKSIPTLSSKAESRIVDVKANSISVREGKRKRLVVLKKSEFHQFWKVLTKRGVLNFAKDIRGRALIRKGSVIVSFMARLPFVEFTLRPRVLHLMPKQTHRPGTIRRRKW